MRITDDFVFFWHGPFSQWYPSPMIINGASFNCAEQWMMYGKAKLFNAHNIAQQIMETDQPKEQKRLGRTIPNFDFDQWTQVCNSLVELGTYNKFIQNSDLFVELERNKDKFFVEASPYDKVWGIGLNVDNDDVLTIEKWRGENRLGSCINNARDLIFYPSTESVTRHKNNIETWNEIIW